MSPIEAVKFSRPVFTVTSCGGNDAGSVTMKKEVSADAPRRVSPDQRTNGLDQRIGFSRVWGIGRMVSAVSSLGYMESPEYRGQRTSQLTTDPSMNPHITSGRF